MAKCQNQDADVKGTLHKSSQSGSRPLPCGYRTSETLFTLRWSPTSRLVDKSSHRFYSQRTLLACILIAWYHLCAEILWAGTIQTTNQNPYLPISLQSVCTESSNHLQEHERIEALFTNLYIPHRRHASKHIPRDEYILQHRTRSTLCWAFHGCNSDSRSTGGRREWQIHKRRKAHIEGSCDGTEVSSGVDKYVWNAVPAEEQPLTVARVDTVPWIPPCADDINCDSDNITL